MMERYKSQSYSIIKSASIKNNEVIVTFLNGDVINVPINQLFTEDNYDGSNFKIFNNEYFIRLISDSVNVEVPWDRLRRLTDFSFKKYTVNIAEESAKKVGAKIKSLREKRGLFAKSIAEETGLTVQTISRIEQGHTDVTFTNLKKILKAMGYELKDLAELENSNIETGYSSKELIQRLEKSGISKPFLITKILPQEVSNYISSNVKQLNSHSKGIIEKYLTEIYNISKSDIWSNRNIKLHQGPYELAFYKKPKILKEKQIVAYSNYVYFIAKIVLKSTTSKKTVNLPKDVEEFKTSLDEYGGLDFENLLRYISDLGIIIIPFNDPGVFHGASWDIEGRKVIILKNGNQTHSRWMFDLLHEVYHIFVHLEDKKNTAILEFDEISMLKEKNINEEGEANNFAKLVLFDEDVEELARECIKNSNNNIRNLKVSFEKLCQRKNIRKDVFADYIAYRLSYSDQNWWGTANKYQITKPSPYDITKRYLTTKMEFNKLTKFELSLINKAF